MTNHVIITLKIIYSSSWNWAWILTMHQIEMEDKKLACRMQLFLEEEGKHMNLGFYPIAFSDYRAGV